MASAGPYASHLHLTPVETDKHASTSSLSFLTGWMLFLPPTAPNQPCQRTEGNYVILTDIKISRCIEKCEMWVFFAVLIYSCVKFGDTFYCKSAQSNLGTEPCRSTRSPLVTVVRLHNYYHFPLTNPQTHLPASSVRPNLPSQTASISGDTGQAARSTDGWREWCMAIGRLRSIESGDTA